MIYKTSVLKNLAIFIEKHLCLSLFLSCNFIKKETLAQGVSCGFCNTFFTENLWMTGSILKQLLDLYFAIIYSWQLSSREKSLVWTKKSSTYFKDFIDLEFFYFLLHKRYTVPWPAHRFVGSETAKSNAFDQFWKFKFHSKHFPGKCFLNFTGPINYFDLFKNHRLAFSWPEERCHPVSKLL